jgi:hypothetical protein
MVWLLLASITLNDLFPPALLHEHFYFIAHSRNRQAHSTMNLIERYEIYARGLKTGLEIIDVRGISCYNLAKSSSIEEGVKSGDKRAFPVYLAGINGRRAGQRR